MLGQFPSLRPAGEITHLWQRGLTEDELCGCGRPFSRCDFWTEVMSDAFGGPDELSSLAPQAVALRDRVCVTARIPQLAFPQIRSSRLERDIRRYSALLRRLYASIVKVSGNRLIIDSSKYPAEAYLLASMDDVDLSIVHLVRDSKAVAYAWKKKKRRPEVVGREDFFRQYSIMKTALAWNVFNSLFGILESRGVSTLVLRYEDLVQDPRSSIERVAAFTGEPLGPPEFIEDREVFLKPTHTVSGNPLRLETGRIELRLDVEWAEGFSWWRKALIHGATLYHRKKFGYS
jgi:hypothetical protein